MSRNKQYISRDVSSIDVGDKEPSWFNDYVANLEKSAVKSRKEDYSLFNQINNILGNKSKYSTVEEAVLDMQRRTGLLEFKKTKEASENLLNNIPELKIFIDNYVKDRAGTSVEAVIHDLLRVPAIRDRLPQNDDVPEYIKEYINNKIVEEKLNHPTSNHRDNFNLGKVDLTVDDNLSSDQNPFRGCEPKKM